MSVTRCYCMTAFTVVQGVHYLLATNNLVLLLIGYLPRVPVSNQYTMLQTIAAVNIPSTEACWSEIAAAAEALPLPTAIPTSAAAKATKSLMPSPTYITVLPKPCVRKPPQLTLKLADMHVSCVLLLDFSCPSSAQSVLTCRISILARAAKSLMPPPQYKHHLPNLWTSTVFIVNIQQIFVPAVIISAWLPYKQGSEQARIEIHIVLCWQTSSMQGLHQICKPCAGQRLQRQHFPLCRAVGLSVGYM